MQTILLIRHAHAVDRDDWDPSRDGPDLQRPLTARGKQQATWIARFLSGLNIAHIRCSPALRCVQTVEPLATRIQRPIIIDPRLVEESAFQLPDLLAGGTHVLCAHGDNIPWALEALDIAWEQCRKGSIWRIERDAGGRVVGTKYLEPEVT